MKSLEIAADEVPDLRLAVEGHTPGRKGKGGEAPGEPPGEEEKKEKKGKKKKKKKEEKERSQRDLKDKKKKKQDEDPKSRKGSTSSTSSSSDSSQKRNPGKKTLEAVFGKTGLDPSPRVRRKLRRKVRKSLKKSKKKKSSGSSNTASSSSIASGDHLFQEHRKVKVIGTRMPGALTAQSIEEMQESLLTASGQVWNAKEDSVPPVAIHYFRTVLQPRMTGGIARESLIVSQPATTQTSHTKPHSHPAKRVSREPLTLPAGTHTEPASCWLGSRQPTNHKKPASYTRYGTQTSEATALGSHTLASHPLNT